MEILNGKLDGCYIIGNREIVGRCHLKNKVDCVWTNTHDFSQPTLPRLRYLKQVVFVQFHLPHPSPNITKCEFVVRMHTAYPRKAQPWWGKRISKQLGFHEQLWQKYVKEIELWQISILVGFYQLLSFLGSCQYVFNWSPKFMGRPVPRTTVDARRQKMLQP